MGTLEHYVQLWLAQESEIKCGERYEISLQQISDTLFCTLRNSKLIIKKMEELEWISWHPGKGRGNRSNITFLKDAELLIFTTAQELVKQGNIKQASKMIDLYQPKFEALKLRFNTWMNTLFGYHVEKSAQQQLDILRLRVDVGTIKLDPVHITLRSDCHFMKHICDTLVRFNRLTNKMEPNIAFHWETSDDDLEWTFYIRKGITFHHGKNLDAYDILCTFERFLQHEQNYYKWLLSGIQSMYVVDIYCFKVKLKKPNSLLLHFLSDEHLSILAKDSHSRDLDKELVGTGPFQLIRNDDSMIVLQVHEMYFRERAFLDRIEVWNIPDDFGSKNENVSFGRALNGGNNASWRHNIQQETNVSYISLNTNKTGPLQNKYFRKALRQIIDSNKLIKQLGDFRGEKAVGFLPSSASQGYKNIEKVESLLERSNYNGETLHLYSFQDTDHVEDCTWIQNECRKYGIIIEVSFLHAEQLLQIATIRDADLIHDSATLDEKMELSFLHLLLSENSPLHQHIHDELGTIISKNIDKLLVEEAKRRIKSLEEIEKLLLEEINIIPLYRHHIHIDHHETVQNVQLNEQGWIDFYDVWFKGYSINKQNHTGFDDASEE
jgi:MarR-like DNA-binding transcriptional regulator SgrR of sgrS sRNA